jgi:FkbM family methyltransferase
MDLRKVEKKGCQFYVREETSDEFVVKEVMSGEYRNLNINSGDVIIDAGLNIGCFTVFALQNGASEVHSYEPESENFKIASANVAMNEHSERATLNNSAIVGTNDAFRTLSVNTKRNKGAHSLVAKRGRTEQQVSCVNINDIIEKHNPTILKLDVEGGEYEILKAITSFGRIEQVVFEFHHAHLLDIETKEKYREIISLMKQHFAYVKYREETKKAWVSIVYCSNQGESTTSNSVG